MVAVKKTVKKQNSAKKVENVKATNKDNEKIIESVADEKDKDVELNEETEVTFGSESKEIEADEDVNESTEVEKESLSESEDNEEVVEKEQPTRIKINRQFTNMWNGMLMD